MAGKRKCLSIKEKIDTINESKKGGLSTRKICWKVWSGQHKEEIRKVYRKKVTTLNKNEDFVTAKQRISVLFCAKYYIMQRA